MSKYITIPFNAVFLDTIAQKWMEEMHSQGGYPCGMVIVPNQRTVKALINSFIKVNKGKPLLLPKIISIGTIDEAGLSFNSKEELTLFPAVHPVKRLSILTSLIIQMNHKLGNQIQAGEAWNLAKSLADLMDEAEWIGCDLKTALSKAVEDEYAQHWQNILKFLSIITEIWPQWLQDNQLMNPVARVIALLKAQAKSWRNSGCQDPVWVVGFADARPVIVEFLSTVVQLPRGRLIVSGLQEDLSEESWNALPITHPYAELVKMFLALGIKRSDFQYWDHICVQPICKERISAFQQILLPADRLESWLINRRPVQLDQCFLIEPLNQQQEAIAIALMIRDALEIPQKRIALVTPDRNLAMRVSLELGRWGVIADDSAGEPLYKTAGTVFLNLILQACVEDFTPLSLLSLLKHPFACCGLPASLCRDYSRLLEIFILRQFAASGLSVIQAALKQKIEEIKLLDKDTLRTDIAYFFSNSSELVSLLDRLKQNVQTLLGKTTKYTVGEWVTYLARAAEQLASNQEQNGEDILWKAEEGNVLAEHLRDLIVETEYIKVVTLSEFASIFRASFQGLIVHTRRALQGREVRQLHPRVYIWGLLEARLQNVDMVILGGLSEGVWPPSIDSGSWLSRPMREKMGMGLPDIEIGRTAYAFMALCCSIPEVILSSPLRQENAPVVQSRWIVRLKAWLKGRKSVIQQHPALMWTKYLDQPDGSPTPMECPSPKPLPALRPKSISITDVERWIKDPYEIYAKKILNLRKIVGLEEDRSTSIFGLIVHEGLKNVYENYSKQWTLSGIEQTLLDALDKRQDILISYKKWWHARLLKIAHWVYQQEKSRRNSRMLPQFYLEKEGHHYFQLTAGIDFTLRGIADRIQLNTDGTVEIYDYKTGVTPACINVKNGLFPQLPLEAAMAYYGGFDKSLAEHEISKFTYWELKGGIEEGKEIHIDNIQKEGDATNLSERYWQVLQKLIIAYCDQEQPYLSCPRPHLIKEYVQTLPVFGDYKHLARFLEWGLGTGGIMMQRQSSFSDPVEEANRQQRDASNPHYSVFVSASAGSGKTKLLVDRLLRLMMPWTDKKGKIHPGIQPQRIQCLTYSKSAAAEMAIRLQKKLSEWVGYTNQELDRALLDLQINPCDKMRRAARALFAEILDLPGGMRIETNHAFCQSILQRFPLEARIIPQFKVIEEGDNLLTFKRAFNEKIDEISDHDIQVLSPLINNNHFLELLQELQQNQQYLQPVLRLIQQRQFSAYLRSCLKLDFSNKQDYLARVCEIWPAEKDIRKCLELNRDIKNKKSRAAIESCIRWFDLSSDQRIVQWDIMQETLLKKNGEVKNFTVNKGENNAIAVLLNEQADYMYQIAETINRYDIYEYTGALLNVFSLIWQHYQDIKRAQGVLHYSDLINYTLDLLDNPGAAWVLFKLDGGLEHILLDEVQDNSAEQWRIADNLSSEFFAGFGKDPVSHHSRTIFAVGDYKQSIYSFQGAKPQEFFNFREKISKKVKEAGELWADPQLRVSFRSSQIILDFVDQVFSPENGLTGVWDNLSMDQFRLHRSAKISAPGRVDIWPLAMMDDMEKEDLETLWKPLRKNQYHSTPDMVLAECLADWIKGQIGRVPPYGGRPIRAGDILILIRKRSDFSRALIRALKMKNIPLVNLVKTQLLDQIAVQDLLVLCEVLLLPQDDLTLACVLKSPLGGLDEESLMELAGSRIKGQTLWNALFIRHLERKDWQEAWLMLSKLFARVDYVTPYALLVEILGEYRGRERFLARLGEEALEAIDELLFQAMQYEDNHIPSLQGFLYWLKQSERTIKNEAEADLDMVRIMTVHGAKGLQGRLVILPDTVNPVSKQGGFQSDQVLVWKEDAEKNIKIPLYVPNKNCDIRESKEYRSFKLQLDTEESNRLLYVALTRASEWLLVCGWQKSKNKKTENTWYDYCEKAMKQLPDLQAWFFQEIWEGTHYFIENKSNSLSYNMNCSPDDFGNQSSKSIILPKWLQQKGKAVALPDENVILPHYIPSRPDGIIFGEVPSKISPVKTRKKKDPFYRGRIIHALLQYLPNYPCEKRYDLAYQWFKRENVKLSGQELNKIVHQVIQLINNPELQKLFDSDSLVEQPVTGIVNDLVITGQIDRMRILPDKILLCDFKSGQKVPDTVEMVSKIYLRQMASYWILLKEIYPYHQIEPLLIWTDALKIMKLPIALLEKYLPAQI